MHPYLVFQLFAWAVWLISSIYLTINWWKDKNEDFTIERWLCVLVGLFCIFTCPILNAAMLIVLCLHGLSLLCDWSNEKIAKMRGKNEVQ